MKTPTFQYRSSSTLGTLKASLLVVCIFSLASLASAQSSRDVFKHMRENNVSITDALTALDVTPVSGWQELFGDEWPITMAESGLLFVDCLQITFRVNAASPNHNLSKDQLKRYAELRALIEMPFIPLCDSMTDTVGRITSLFMTVTVWTVGDVYPVAYHIDVTTNMIGAPNGQSDEPFTEAYLGYARSTSVGDQVQEAIHDVVRSLALTAAEFRR